MCRGRFSADLFEPGAAARQTTVGPPATWGGEWTTPLPVPASTLNTPDDIAGLGTVHLNRSVERHSPDVEGRPVDRHASMNHP